MKAILVVDMPGRCGDCRLADFGKCWGSNSYLHLSTKDRPKECPLKPMPQRKRKIKELSQYTKEYEAYCKGEVDGWNFCLDEILGDENADKKEE